MFPALKKGLWICGWLATAAWVTHANAQTFDPTDPYRLVFLDQLTELMGEAETVSKAFVKLNARGGDPDTLNLDALRRIRLGLTQELSECGTPARRSIEQIAIGLMGASFERPDRMRQLGVLVQLIEAGYRTDTQEIERLVEKLDPRFLNLGDIDGDGILSVNEPLPEFLLDEGGLFLSRNGFYRSILAIGNLLHAKNALSDLWRNSLYPRAMFFMGEVEQVRAYAEKNQIDLIDDWLITAALRAGAESDALAIQQRLDSENPDNLSRLLFFESPGARAAHCGNMMSELAAEEANQAEEEADGSLSWFYSWSRLLCGEFADSRRAALKSTWANRAGSCARKQTNIDLVDQYNAILAGVYLSAQLRESGARERASELLDTIAAEVRQALFLDSFSGYSNLEIVLEDDIAVYMMRLHGPRAELSLVKGMLERGRGELETARADFTQALRRSGVGPQDAIEANMDQSDGLAVEWLLQLAQWVEEIDAALQN